MSHELKSFDLAALDPMDEARRQIEICNACRYCEGFCAVFPAMTRQKAFADGDLTQLANLCHNCRGCYYACQYTAPHEFALNIPAALAEVRVDSWERLARPQAVARAFQSHGVAMAGLLVVALAWFFWALTALRPDSGAGFYAHLAHNTLVAIFVPAFVLPLALIALSVRDYWREVGGGRVRLAHLLRAFDSAARMKNLSGGHGEGCNFEQGDRFSNRRRVFHQLMMYGFLLCFGATASGTVMHYALGWEAPYPLWSLPKLLGVPGGVMMVAGAAGLAWLKLRADPALGAARVWGGEMAFVLLLGAVALTGLALYAATGSGLVGPLLAIHLATVMVLFLLMPFSKMVHGFFRLAALVAEAGKPAPGGGGGA
ncbi:citrate/tricarballylate utilization protein [Gemmobacter megaterium]|uniref:Citrate/tricarballylate utilization protein n=1 Tax=Gemmobacter megaterium TaxID=1086013 RepID=A0A1N7N737_9RHOB|nr:tricarballylate utilization 4Fe-4S protein TcuB [Gemmobacter megaterium]GGE13342.1 tricarballylate utilization protein B [Gemmobacter megaterium]SIS93999.1 citrate/tricarballylate utilization protein [Gemmobacter megaterium]